MRIDTKKLMERVEEIYNCGKQEDGSFSRVAYSPQDIRGREKFVSYFKALGIEPVIDKAGNIIARLEGKNPDLPAIVIGSHLDTVPDGGKYDGVLGCLGGLGVCEAVVKSGQRMEHPLEVIVFTDEEGARFGSGMTGSAAFCGMPPDFADSDIDIYGMNRGGVFESFGIRADSLAQAERRPGTVRCFIELHIEQGSSLYKNNVPVGVVTSIAGVKRYEVVVMGESNHAGSTMMPDRKDSLVAAARFISAIPDIVAEHGGEFTVATVGTIRVEPGSVNVIPGVCVFSLEIRDQSQEMMDTIERLLRERLKKDCRWLTHSFRQIASHDAAPMTDWVMESIRDACEKQGCAYQTMPSGAFHDSLLISARFPTGMIFIPSVGGISHSPREFSTAADIEKGCDVLLRTVLIIDNK